MWPRAKKCVLIIISTTPPKDWKKSSSTNKRLTLFFGFENGMEIDESKEGQQESFPTTTATTHTLLMLISPRHLRPNL